MQRDSRSFRGILAEAKDSNTIAHACIQEFTLFSLFFGLLLRCTYTCRSNSGIPATSKHRARRRRGVIPDESVPDIEGGMYNLAEPITIMAGRSKSHRLLPSLAAIAVLSLETTLL